MPLQSDGCWLAPPSLSRASPPPLLFSFMLGSSLCPVPVSLTRRGGGGGRGYRSPAKVGEASDRIVGQTCSAVAVLAAVSLLYRCTVIVTRCNYRDYSPYQHAVVETGDVS